MQHCDGHDGGSVFSVFSVFSVCKREGWGEASHISPSSRACEGTLQHCDGHDGGSVFSVFSVFSVCKRGGWGEAPHILLHPEPARDLCGAVIVMDDGGSVFCITDFCSGNSIPSDLEVPTGRLALPVHSIIFHSFERETISHPENGCRLDPSSIKLVKRNSD